MTIRQHKPRCKINLRCLVYHADGICPGPYGTCTCDELPDVPGIKTDYSPHGISGTDTIPVSEPTPPPTEWKEKLDDFAVTNELYLRGVNITKLSAFIESLLAEQKARMIEVVDEIKHEYTTKKRATSFQDTLFGHAVDVCDYIIKALPKVV